ncbi:hypothetical protein [Capnocytophaga stomatis]|uniref:hypothetical protein n=1 Tax=Capnocytophaga stomatis TaxID=1848904 RepID=UPI0012FFC488|nr:hypothetical protein [Capnocytophaga stomatis]
MSEKEILNLKKELNLFCQFPDRPELINSSREFLEIYTRCINKLNQLALERNSKYLAKQTNELPFFNNQEVKLFISQKRKEVSFLEMFFKGFYIIYSFLLVRNTFQNIQNKMKKMQFLTKRLIDLVENPNLEQAYTQVEEKTPKIKSIL